MESIIELIHRVDEGDRTLETDDYIYLYRRLAERGWLFRMPSKYWVPALYHFYFLRLKWEDYGLEPPAEYHFEDELRERSYISDDWAEFDDY